MGKFPPCPDCERRETGGIPTRLNCDGIQPGGNVCWLRRGFRSEHLLAKSPTREHVPTRNSEEEGAEQGKSSSGLCEKVNTFPIEKSFSNRIISRYRVPIECKQTSQQFAAEISSVNLVILFQPFAESKELAQILRTIEVICPKELGQPPR